MKVNGKRGLSPVIASILLIAIVVVLAVLIFMWARGFVTEKVMKFNEPIENLCDKVKMKAEAYGGNVLISNEGSVPIYGLEITKKGIGSSASSGPIPFDSTVVAGQTGKLDLPASFGSGSSITVMPVLLGESGNLKKSYTCSAPTYDLEVGV